MRRDAQLLAAAPSDGANVSVGQIVGGSGLAAGIVYLFWSIGNLKVEHAARLDQTLGVFAQLEDFAAIKALTFEYGTGVVQTVRKHMDVGIAPWP